MPHFAGIEGARRAAAAVRYPPLAERGGAGSTRAAGFGAVPWTEQVRTSKEEILMVVMTEERRGLDEIEQIEAVDGLDVITLGPTDISNALGMTDPSDPRLHQTFVDLAARVNPVGKARVCIPVNHTALRLSSRELPDMGVNYASVTPVPATIVLNSLRESAARIREEAAWAPVT